MGSVNILTIAEHEAAHAVMRWLRGLPATDVYVEETGGFTDGTGRRVDPENNVLVALAGFAWETGCGMCEPDWTQVDGFENVNYAPLF